MWLEIIENARANESRSGNRYGGIGNAKVPQNRSTGGGIAAASTMNSKNQNIYFDNQDDESSLDNYLDIPDAETVAFDKSYGAAPNDYYYTGKIISLITTKEFY